MAEQDRSGSKAQPHSGARTAKQRWSQLDGVRTPMMYRFEKYAEVTLPQVLLPKHLNEFSESIQHDWHSFGAQAVNHLTNRLVMTLFQPGMPFFRLDPDQTLRKELQKAGVSEDELRGALVTGEQEALRVLDQKAVRPHLNDVVRALIVIGNILLDLSDEDAPRTISLRDYVLKRSISGKVFEILHREKVFFDEVDEEAKKVLPAMQPDKEVEVIRWFVLKGGKWKMDTYVDHFKLPGSFSQTWSEDKFPIYPLVWSRAAKHTYGTGLVEEYAGDFGTLSTLTESEIKAAILASDYRWLANPAGVGDIDEFRRSTTGDIIPGVKDDLALVAHVSTQSLKQIGESADRVLQRVGRAFLMNSAITRDAERVTAEEIRMQANELETSLGGVYSRLAVELQLPIAMWLLRQIDVEVAGTHLVPTIVTGLAALSRNAEAQQLGLFLDALGKLAALPPAVLVQLKQEEVQSTLAAAYGLDAKKYVKPQAQVNQELAQAQQAQTDQASQEAMAAEGAKVAAKEATNE